MPIVLRHRARPRARAILTGQWHWRLAEGANLRGFLPKRFDVYPDLTRKGRLLRGLLRKRLRPGGLGDRTRNPAGPAFRSIDSFFADRPAGKPFCFWYGSHNPHRGYKWQSGRERGFDPAKVQVPPYLPDNETVRDDIADYYAEVETLDNEAASVLAVLEKIGELDNTVIAMSGDNGWPFPRCKANLYVSGTHQPLAIRWGAKVKGGRTIDDFVSLSDLRPTFLEAAGVPIPEAVTARSLLPPLLSNRSGALIRRAITRSRAWKFMFPAAIWEMEPSAAIRCEAWSRPTGTTFATFSPTAGPPAIL